MIEHLPFIKATACGNDFLLIDGGLTTWEGAVRLYLPPDGARVGLSGGGDRVLFGQVEVGG